MKLATLNEVLRFHPSFIITERVVKFLVLVLITIFRALCGCAARACELADSDRFLSHLHFCASAVQIAQVWCDESCISADGGSHQHLFDDCHCGQ